MTRRCLAVILSMLIYGEAIADVTSTPDGLTLTNETRINTNTKPNKNNIFEATVPAPPIYTKLWWNNGSSTTIGYWYTKDQVVRINAQLEYLTNNAAHECIDATIKEEKNFLMSTPGLIIVGAITAIIGFGVGFGVARRF